MRLKSALIFTIGITSFALNASDSIPQSLPLPLDLPAGEIKRLPENAQVDIPPSWSYSPMVQSLPVEDKWWNNFHSPLLDSLINIAIDNNYNIKLAIRRIEVARLQMQQSKSGYYPTLQLSAGWEKERTAGIKHKEAATTYDYFNIGADMSWQIDLFGKVRANVNAQKANWQATKAEYTATMVSVAASVATTYIQLRCYQAQLANILHQSKEQQRILKIAQTRFETGLVSKLDVTQAKTVCLSTQAEIPALKANIESSINALATLLGIYPSQLPKDIYQDYPMPQYNQDIAVGIPMDLLRRRPDIVEAEYNLAEYAAQLGVAEKDFLPTLTLDGSIGTSAHEFKNLFSNASFTYSIAPTLSWTLFDGFSRKYAVAEAREELESGIESYNLTVMTAVQEVNDAISSYTNLQNEMDLLNQAATQAEESLTLSLDSYTQGLSEFVNVVNAQMSYLEYSDQCISAQGEALIALINLYKALGGGW
jgi:NodT family efflux transporter outer membrane factor (OMF) lipoprotein